MKTLARLCLGIDVDAGLDDGVGALAEHFASQPVQLLEGVGGQGGGAGGRKGGSHGPAVLDLARPGGRHRPSPAGA